jgi:hypothetical protein
MMDKLNLNERRTTMKTATRKFAATALALALALLALALPGLARAHCDSLDGPVVADARSALGKGEVTPVLKWVKADDEPEIRDAFARAVAVRKLGPEAQQLAETFFFETLVRVHRAGEGAPFTGLKPAGAIEPPIAAADQALADGSVDPLAQKIAEHAAAGVRERFARALAAKKHAGESVAAGREYVEAYVTYVHYVEGVVQAVHAEAHHGEEAPAHKH